MELIVTLVKQHDESAPGVKLVWKTQPAAGCGYPSGPSKPPDELFWQNYLHGNPERKIFNWPSFAAFDTVARHHFGGSHRAQNRFLLDTTALNHRLDAHPGSNADIRVKEYRIDCLHQCIPGPLDHLLPRLLLHMMLHEGL